MMPTTTCLGHPDASGVESERATLPLDNPPNPHRRRSLRVADRGRVEEFRADHGITADGIVGPSTDSRLLEPFPPRRRASAEPVLKEGDGPIPGDSGRVGIMHLGPIVVEEGVLGPGVEMDGGLAPGIP